MEKEKYQCTYLEKELNKFLAVVINAVNKDKRVIVFNFVLSLYAIWSLKKLKYIVYWRLLEVDNKSGVEIYAYKKRDCINVIINDNININNNLI